MTISTAAWHIIRTKPRAEYMAARELDRDGFEIFFPRIKVAQPRVGHTDDPLFPGYLLIKCHLEGENRPVFRERHQVLGWVRFGDDIPSLPDETVAEITGYVESTNNGGGLWESFQPGQQVRVVTKNLDTLARVIEGAKSPSSKAKVLLHFMGRLIQAQVPWADLRPTEETSTEFARLPRRTRGKGRWTRGFGPSGTNLSSA